MTPTKFQLQTPRSCRSYRRKDRMDLIKRAILTGDGFQQSAADCVQPKGFAAVNHIVVKAAEVFDVPESDIRGDRRFARVALARQAACWAARKYTTLSFHEIGHAIRKGLDHGTVIHACKLIETQRQIYPEMAALVQALEDSLKIDAPTLNATTFHFK